MAELSVEMTYGQALFDAAVDTNQLEKIQQETNFVLELLKGNDDFFKFVTMPSIDGEEKKEVLQEVFAGKLSKETLNFLFILIDKGRIGHFEKIVRHYRSLHRAHSEVCAGVVYSVEPLDSAQHKKLEADLSTLLRKQVVLTNERDLSLLGGIKVQIEGKVLDASLKKKLEELKRDIKSGRQ